MEAESALQEVLEGGVAKIILKNAFAAWPTDLPLRNAFLSTLAEFDASLVEDFEDRICGDLKDGFGKVTAPPGSMDCCCLHANVPQEC